MKRVFQSTLRILAAQIIAIELAPPAQAGAEPAGLFLKTDSEEVFTVPTDWAAKNGVQVGGYLGTTGGAGGQGQAMFIPADRFPVEFAYVGDVDVPAAPAADNAVDAAGAALAPDTETTYTFEQFLAYGRANAGVGIDGMPWSFTFHGRPVSHESDDRYLITTKAGKTLDFKRGETLHIDGDDSIWIEG